MEALGKDKCTPADRAKCEQTTVNLEWECANCPKIKQEDVSISAYTAKLLMIHNMAKGGYPLDKDDLTIDEWIHLGRLKDLNQQQFKCPVNELLKKR